MRRPGCHRVEERTQRRRHELALDVDERHARLGANLRLEQSFERAAREALVDEGPRQERDTETPERGGVEHFVTRAVATASIGDYLEAFYNPTRRHSHLGYKSPIEFELKRQISAFADTDGVHQIGGGSRLGQHPGRQRLGGGLVRHGDCLQEQATVVQLHCGYMHSAGGAVDCSP